MVKTLHTGGAEIKILDFGHFFLFIFSIISTIEIHTGKTSSENFDLSFFGLIGPLHSLLKL